MVQMLDIQAVCPRTNDVYAVRRGVHPDEVDDVNHDLSDEFPGADITQRPFDLQDCGDALEIPEFLKREMKK